MQEGLTPQHLKKAKLMFFYTRYPSANTLKTFFGDVKVCFSRFLFLNGLFQLSTNIKQS